MSRMFHDVILPYFLTITLFIYVVIVICWMSFEIYIAYRMYNNLIDWASLADQVQEKSYQLR